MTKGLVTIFGGSGFLGRHAARELVKAGYRVRIACRNTGPAGDVRLAGAPGWVDVVQANIRNRPSIARALEGADAVVNLVGILPEYGRQTYQSVQVDGARNVAELAAEAGITRFVQVSALGADAEATAKHARTKAAGEAAVREAIPQAVILRPATVFGPEDRFLNRFAQMAKGTWLLPVIGGGEMQLQPVYAGDVAEAIAAAVSGEDTAGETYELGGPRTYTVNEIYDFICQTTGRKRLKLSVPFVVARLFALVLGGIYRVPGLNLLPAIFFRILPATNGGKFWVPPITTDEIELLRTDNTTSPDAKGFAALGIHDIESVEAIGPTYLWRHRPYGEFTQISKA